MNIHFIRRIFFAAAVLAVPQAANSAVPDGQNAKEIIFQARALRDKGDLLNAQAVYRKALDRCQDCPTRQAWQDEARELNVQILLSALNEPQTTYTVVSGDTLGKIAKKFGTTVDFIKKKNGLESDIIRVGQQLTVWTGKFEIQVDKSDNLLYVKSNDAVVRTYQISTGRGDSTPEGEFSITSKMEHPVWFNKGKAIPPGTKDNHLGTRWLGFDKPQYGIHGTIEPELIGQSVSHGCIRMRNEEVEELFSYIPMGTRVQIVQ